MTGQIDFNTILAGAAVVLSLITAVINGTRERGVESQALREAVQTAIDGLRREMDAKLDKLAAEDARARHDANAGIQHVISGLVSDLREIRKDSFPRTEATEMEKRLTEMAGEIKRDLRELTKSNADMRDIMSRVSAQLEKRGA